MCELIGTAGMPAVAGQLHRLACVMTIDTAKLGVLGRLAIAGRMRALLIFRHSLIPLPLDYRSIFKRAVNRFRHLRQRNGSSWITRKSQSYQRAADSLVSSEPHFGHSTRLEVFISI
jgi:hypothetical protein